MFGCAVCKSKFGIVFNTVILLVSGISKISFSVPIMFTSREVPTKMTVKYTASVFSEVISGFLCDYLDLCVVVNVLRYTLFICY